MLRSSVQLLLIGSLAAVLACAGKKPVEEKTEFTEIDSLTDTYLILQDSIVNTWNAIIGDENEKLKSLHELLHALLATEKQDKGSLISLEERLDKLEELRFTQETLNDPHTVEEYDFTSNSLISEIISEAESRPDFPTSKDLQTLVDRVKIADQHISIYRTDYDSAASRFNSFLDENKDELMRLDESLSKEKKPLF